MLLLMDDTTSSLISDDSHNPFAKHILASNRQHQYSYYAIDVIGVLHTLVTQKYPLIINVHYAMQTAMN